GRRQPVEIDAWVHVAADHSHGAIGIWTHGLDGRDGALNQGGRRRQDIKIVVIVQHEVAASHACALRDTEIECNRLETGQGTGEGGEEIPAGSRCKSAEHLGRRRHWSIAKAGRYPERHGLLGSVDESRRYRRPSPVAIAVVPKRRTGT